MISSFVRLGLSVWLTHVFSWRWWIGRGVGWSFVGDHIPGLVMLFGGGVAFSKICKEETKCRD